MKFESYFYFSFVNKNKMYNLKLLFYSIITFFKIV